MDNSQWGQPSEEWLKFANANPSLVAPAPKGMSALEQQTLANNLRAKNSLARLESSGLKAAVETRDYAVPTREGGSITVRAYRPAAARTETLPLYVHYHGGGFLLGNLETEGFNCSWLSHALSIVVLHVAYRCTPQHTGLTAWHDALDGFKWAMANAETLNYNPGKVLVGGISAGGCLTATVLQAEVQRARETKTPVRVKGQILHIPTLVRGEGCYPWDWFADRSKASMVQCAEADCLNKARMDLYWSLLGTDVAVDHPTWNPGLVAEEDLAGTPPTFMAIAGWDPLRDEGLGYALKLKRAGVRTKVHIFPGLPHLFLGFPQLPSQQRWSEVTLESMRWALADESEWIVERAPPAIPKAPSTTT
ncbi:alpha/beta-hydrolase [Xylariaceae sp. FL0594]|nr:alpha/beta-hydrolase [Xylariaceae sp. FL0594]